MKIKKIIKLCKDAYQLILYVDPVRNMQWLSDGHAIYPLQGCPMFEEDSFCNTYEINDTQRNKIVFRINEELPGCYNFGDNDNLETVAERLPLAVCYSSYNSVALKTEHGVEFINAKHLMPFADYDSKDLSFSLRHTESGQPYFAVKNGFMLIGIIEPIKMIDKIFLEELKAFEKQVEITIYNNSVKSHNPQLELDEVAEDV